MVDHVRAEVGEDLVERCIPNVALVELDGRIEIGAVAGGQVVDHGHLVALGAKAVGDVRADEPGSASHENSHSAIIAEFSPRRWRLRLLARRNAVQRQLLARQLGGGAQKIAEQRVRPIRAALELGMELRCRA